MVSPASHNYTATYASTSAPAQNRPLTCASRVGSLGKRILLYPFQTFVFPAASAEKKKIVDEERIAAAKKGLIAIGGEPLRLRTPDGETIEAMHLSADRFYKIIHERFDIVEVERDGAKQRILMLKPERRRLVDVSWRGETRKVWQPIHEEDDLFMQNVLSKIAFTYRAMMQLPNGEYAAVNAFGPEVFSPEDREKREADKIKKGMEAAEKAEMKQALEAVKAYESASKGEKQEAESKERLKEAQEVQQAELSVIGLRGKERAATPTKMDAELKTKEEERKVRPPTHPTAIICGGSGMDIFAYKSLAAAYLMRGLDVMLFNYHGYGESSGSPTDQNTFLDLETCYQYLRDEHHVENSELVVHGHCMGAGPASDLAARHQGVNLILDRTFGDYADFAARAYPRIGSIVQRIMPRIVNYNVAANLRQVTGHIAVNIDDQDTVITKEDTSKILTSIPVRPGQAVEFIQSNIGHTGMWTDHVDCSARLDNFLMQANLCRTVPE